MDKVVDHLLVFNGDGEIKDFPGNYTQYRGWSKEPSQLGRSAQASGASNTSTTSNASQTCTKRKLTYKEKRELEQLEKDIEALEAEQKALEEALCSGTLSVEELTEKSKRLPLLKDELDEKSMRWLELSEI